ncbi:MAG: hypothetical protein R3B48_13275 [Kofleriaceae bacterium]
MTSPASAGARFTLLRCAPGSDAAARYDATIQAGEASYRAELTLRDDGTVEAQPLGEPAPAALWDKLIMFARLTARGAPSRRAEGVVVWPARVTRWRPS